MSQSTIRKRSKRNDNTANNTNAPTTEQQQQQPKQQFGGISIWSRLIHRFIMLCMVWGGMYLFYFKQADHDQNRLMASVSDNIVDVPLIQELPCSDHYVQERTEFPKCAPIRCGRFVGDSIVDEHETMELRLLAETVFGISQPSGGVAIFDLASGALSNGTKFVNLWHLVKKRKNNLISKKSLDTFHIVKNKVIYNLAIQFGISPDQIHLTKPVFFTRITDAPAATLNDQYWHPHVDKVTYGTFVYTSLLYLSTYGNEFKGGRFFFLDNKRNVTIEPKFGRISAFTSSSENQHMVEQVDSGARFALTIPFTCDKSQAVNIPTID